MIENFKHQNLLILRHEVSRDHPASSCLSQGRRKIDNWGGVDIHVLVFTGCKNNRFQKKLMMQNTNI